MPPAHDHEGKSMNIPTPTARASRWLSDFAAALAKPDIAATVGMFDRECYWRDLLSFTWNIKTVEGHDAIADMLDRTVADARPCAWSIVDEASDADGVVEAWFDFETTDSRGRGHMRLRGDRCWTLLTTMLELKGHEEPAGTTRDKGVAHGAFKDRKTWLERKTEEESALGYTRQPYCVIIGGGQGGIMLGARLKRLGVPTIILEKNERAGDSWRKRYKTLVLHDPVWYDHLPYLPFPDHWPVFTPKDQMGDWLEMYTKVMQLNYWASSECVSAEFDEAREEWTVLVRRGGKEVVLRPKQLVFATGSYGPPNEVTLPGVQRFRGEHYHSSNYASGDRYAGKPCIVVGSNSSAHDVCADLWEQGADVTMVQRSSTTVVKSETLMEVGFASLYSEEAVKNGISTQKADLIFASIPFRLMAGMQIPLYQTIASRDADLYARLAKAGFLLDWGEDGSGLMMKALRTGSGYYIDVGASDLIAKGEIKLKSGVEVKEVRERSVILTDGGELPAELIVCATGYRPMNAWVAKLISEDVADRIGPNWGYGSGTSGDPGPWLGELRNMWKPMAYPALWFHGGNLALSRHYSLYVGLQIKARMEGIPTPVYR
jgi:putative flavoprotein involved in K+ transport